MTQTYKVQVSMNQAHIVESGLVWKQGDFGFNIEIEVLDFDTTGATPQIIFRKSTGAVEATQISVAGNKFTYAIRGTELDTPGPCVCDLKLKDSTTKRVSTASFKYFVIPDTMDGLEQEASSYSDTIEQLLENTIQKSETEGLMKNDGSVDTNIYALSSALTDASEILRSGFNYNFDSYQAFPTIMLCQGIFDDNHKYKINPVGYAVSTQLIPYKPGLIIKTDSAYKFKIIRYTDIGAGYRSTDWNNEYTLPEDDTFKFFALSIMNASLDTSASITPIDLDNKLFITSKANDKSLPMLVILDTDWWTDCDDAVAIRTLLWAEQQGMCDIVGLIVDAVKDTSAISLARYLDYEGRGDLPFALEKNATDYGGTPSYYDSIINNWTQGKYRNNNECYDENEGEYYIKLLESVPAGRKVVIISIGYLSALAGLFNRAENDSKIMALVKDKIEKIYCMAGQYPSGLENNFKRNARARQAGYDVCTKCPDSIPIVFLGYEVGESVLSGGTTGQEIGSFDILYKILVAHGEGANGRSSWDPMTTLLALLDNPNTSGYNLVRGVNVVDASTGANTFTANSTGHHYYVVKKYPDAWYSHQINKIVERIGWKYRHDIGEYTFDDYPEYMHIYLDGSENWQFNTNNEPNQYGYYNAYLINSPLIPNRSMLQMDENYVADGFCSHTFKLNKTSRLDTNHASWGYLGSDPSIFFRFNSSIATSVESFKQYLHNHPVTIYLKLANIDLYKDYLRVHLDGSENWQFNTNNEPNQYGYYNAYLIDSPKVPARYMVENTEGYLNDGFTSDDLKFELTTEGRSLANKPSWGYWGSDPSIFFRFNSSFANSVESFKQYLHNHPITLYLRMASIE